MPDPEPRRRSQHKVVHAADQSFDDWSAYTVQCWHTERDVADYHPGYTYCNDQHILIAF